MRLTELGAKFLRHYQAPYTEEGRRLNPHFPPEKLHDFFEAIDDFDRASGIRFTCPRSKGGKREHEIYVMFEGSTVPQNLYKNKEGQTVRWKASGTGYEDLTLTPSIQEQDYDYTRGDGTVEKACQWHGFVTNGDAR